MIEIKIQKEKLLDCLLRLRRSFATKNVLPILNDYKFEINGSTLSVAVLDCDTLTRESFVLPDEAINFENDNRKSWCINRWFIVPGLRTLDDQDITMQVMDYQVRIVHNLGNFSVPIEDAGEYPEFKCGLGDKAVTSLNLEVPGLRHWLNVLHPAIANDFLRPVMNGICFDCDEDSLTLCASDGHKLIRIFKTRIGGYKQSFIMPHKVINILSYVLPKTGMVNFRFSQTGHTAKEKSYPVGHIDIGFENDADHKLEIDFQGIDGRYPNYNSVIPATNANCISVNRRRLKQSIERAKCFSNESDLMVKLRIGNGMIIFNSNDKDFQLQCDESIPCEILEGKNLPMTIALKSSHVIDLIKHISTGNILIKFQDPQRAIIMEPDPQPDVENITLLQMPMFYND